MRGLHRHATAALLLLAAPLGTACHHEHPGPADLDAGIEVEETRDLATDDALPAIDLGGVDFGIDPGGHGGTVDLLSFAVFGDARPPLPDEGSHYPTAVVTGIMQEIAGISPQLVVGTGDYMYVEFSSAEATKQVGYLKSAEASVTAPIFHAMGNHECNSFSDLNCPTYDESVNVTTYLTQLVPFTPVPWYSFVVHTSLGDAKFLFIAANAWNDTQAAWLTQAIAMPTAYTFVIRHQPTPDAGGDSGAAGVAASDAILAGHPVTLFLYGHVHEYAHITTNAVVSGNGGAPLTSGSYGWLQILQRVDGSVSVTAHQLGVSAPIDTWAVTPDGQAD